ncbi:MAG: flagellar biosynthetic protein FliO, partial [Bdellovibrionales bacterium]|nr:flagellar biosynthetic protein FliO [Bdellovibrionales bacterium]
KNYSATEIVERELGEDFRNESLNDPAKKDATAKEEFKKQIDEELDKRSLSASEAEPLVAKGKIVKEKKGKRSDLDESQIPVLAGEAGKKEESRSPLMRVFMSFVVLLVAAIGMVLFTKWWSKHKTKSLGDNHIRVVTQHHLGPKKSIAIIRVAGESILIGVTDQNISMLKTLALIDDEIPEESPDNFEGTLNSMVEDENGVEKIKDRVSVARVAEENNEKDEFNYGQIKDMVATKLKKMRTL